MPPTSPFLTILMLLLLLAGGCAGQFVQAPNGSSATAPTQQLESATPVPPQPGATATAPYASPTPSILPNTRYHLSVDLDYDRHLVEVQERIQYSNHSTDPLAELRLVVPPEQYPGVFTLKAITWEDGQAVNGAGWQENHVLVAPLAQPLPPGGSLTLNIHYSLALPAPAALAGDRPVPFGYKERQTNLVDWYSFVPPYVNGKGWLAHPSGYYGEHLVFELADFEVDLRLTSARPLVIAASSAEEGGASDRQHRYRLDNARNFALSLSPDYQVTREQVGDLEIVSYAFPVHAAAGQAAGKTTAEAAAVFNERFGPLARGHLSVVEADFLDGMEYDGLYFLSDGFYNLYQGQPGEYLVAIATHETAHQWWYASVGSDQALEPWLDEALATYSERLYYEQVHPEALDWWWSSRVNYFQPGGWVDSSIYEHIGQGSAYVQYRNAVYLNGAVFLEDARKAMGDEAFFAFLKDYAQSNAGKIATREDFFAALGRHTSGNMTPIIQKYFKEP